MKIVLAICGNGYCGCESEDAFFYEEDVTINEIGDEIWDWACGNAESFAHVHFGWGEEYTDEDWEDYIENHITCDWHFASFEEYCQWCDNWGYEPRVIN